MQGRDPGDCPGRACVNGYFLAATISISIRAAGVANLTSTVERAGLLGWVAVPKRLDHSAFIAGKLILLPLAGSATMKTVAFTTSPKVSPNCLSVASSLLRESAVCCVVSPQRPGWPSGIL